MENTSSTIEYSTPQNKNDPYLKQREHHLNTTLFDLIQNNQTKPGYSRNAKFPVYNLSDFELPPHLNKFLQSTYPKMNIYAYKHNDLSIMCEVDCIGSDIELEYKKNGAELLQAQKKYQKIRTHAYGFMNESEKEFNKQQHRMIRQNCKELKTWLDSNKLIALEIDKTKGWCITTLEHVTSSMEEHIKQNFEEFIHPNKNFNNTLESYLKYREGVVRRITSKLNLNKTELRKANTQASSIAELLPLCKIHKLTCISKEHANGIPISKQLNSSSNTSIAKQLKFRFIQTMSNAPSSNLGSVLGKKLKCLQNSGIRMNSMQEINKSIQKDARERPMDIEKEEYCSFDMVKFYESVQKDTVKECIRMSWRFYEKETPRNERLNLEAVMEAIDCIYNEGILFQNRVYKLASGSSTGHSFTSASQNIVLSLLERVVIIPLQKKKTITQYHRWVDDMFTRAQMEDQKYILQCLKNFFIKLHARLKTKDWEIVRSLQEKIDKLKSKKCRFDHTMAKNIKEIQYNQKILNEKRSHAINSDYRIDFTIERPTPIVRDSKIYKALPFLDFCVLTLDNSQQPPTTSFSSTVPYSPSQKIVRQAQQQNLKELSKDEKFRCEVYSKPTASETTMLWSEFCPLQWKINSLSFYVRRAIEYSSDYKIMDNELQKITKKFSTSGYPKRIIAQTINRLTQQILMPEKTTKQTAEDNNNKKYIPLLVPYAGLSAHKSMTYLKKQIPSDFFKISIAYKAQKLHHLFNKFSSCEKTNDIIFLRNNIVYLYKCSGCGKVYIGETLRRFCIRIDEHINNKSSSAIYHHHQHCSKVSGEIDKSNFSILQKNLRHTEARKRFETLYINFFNKSAESDTMNENTASRTLTLF